MYQIIDKTSEESGTGNPVVSEHETMADAVASLRARLSEYRKIDASAEMRNAETEIACQSPVTEDGEPCDEETDGAKWGEIVMAYIR